MEGKLGWGGGKNLQKKVMVRARGVDIRGEPWAEIRGRKGKAGALEGEEDREPGLRALGFFKRLEEIKALCY